MVCCNLPQFPAALRMDSIRVMAATLAPAHAVPLPPSPPLAECPPIARAAAARKARFWDRIARKYAADPIADMAGYEATLRAC
jgi:hypothetical protein